MVIGLIIQNYVDGCQYPHNIKCLRFRHELYPATLFSMRAILCSFHVYLKWIHRIWWSGEITKILS